MLNREDVKQLSLLHNLDPQVVQKRLESQLVMLRRFEELHQNTSLTSLIWATANNYPLMVEYILLSQENRNMIDEKPQGLRGPVAIYNDKTPLQIAAIFGYRQIVKSLLKAGAHVTLATPDTKLQAIHFAVLRNDLELVQILMEAYPGLFYERDGKGRTPLMIAELKNYQSISQYLPTKRSLSDLPREIVLDTFANLMPEIILKRILLLGKTFSLAIKNSLEWQNLWRAKFQVHFPDVFATMLSKKDEHIDWYDNFFLHYKKSYPDKLGWLFSLVKENAVGDHYDAKNNALPLFLPNSYKHYHFLDIPDSSNKSILTWAREIHHTLKKVSVNKLTALDYFYQLNHNFYLKNVAVDITKRDYWGNLFLYYLIVCKGPLNDFIEFIERGYSLNFDFLSTIAQGHNLPIHVAAQFGRLDIVKYIIEQRPEFLNAIQHSNYNENPSKTPLMLAAANGHIDIVKFLLQQDTIDIDAESDTTHNQPGKRTALHYACENGHPEVVRALLKKNANANLIDDYFPIELAAREGNLEVIKIFVELQLDFDRRDRFGQTAFLWAAAKGHLDVVEFFLSIKEKINLNAATIIGPEKTALYWAIQNGHTKVAMALLIAGMEFPFNRVKELIENQPELLYHRDRHGRTLLMTAAEKGGIDMVRYLLSRIEIDVEASSKNYPNPKDNNKTALHYAAENGYNDIVELLLQKGAYISATKPLNVSKLNQAMKIEIARCEENIKFYKRFESLPFSFFKSSFNSVCDKKFQNNKDSLEQTNDRVDEYNEPSVFSRVMSF